MTFKKICRFCDLHNKYDQRLGPAQRLGPVCITSMLRKTTVIYLIIAAGISVYRQGNQEKLIRVHAALSGVAITFGTAFRMCLLCEDPTHS